MFANINRLNGKEFPDFHSSYNAGTHKQAALVSGFKEVLKFME